MMTDPLIFAGAFHEGVAVVFPATAGTESGTDGAALIAAAGEAVDADEFPIALVAITLNV